MDASFDHGYMCKHTKLNRYVQKWDDIHASDEFAGMEVYEEPKSPTSEAIINAIMFAYPDKF